MGFWAKTQIAVNSGEEMHDLGVKIVNSCTDNLCILGLIGDLGAGKTTLAQGIALALGVTDAVTSPTFVIMKRFEADHSRFDEFYHIDCYRLEDSQELLNLDFERVASKDGAFVVVEWADRVRDIMPHNTRWIRLSGISKDKRTVYYE